MLCFSRPKLLTQALETLFRNTDSKDFNLTLVLDQPEDFRIRKIVEPYFVRSNVTSITIDKSAHVLARAKNLGAYWSEQAFGRGDWLYLSDSDVAFLPDWLGRLTEFQVSSGDWKPTLCGGQVHPFHKPREDPHPYIPHPQYSVLDGPSWFMRWNTWDFVGPLDATCAPGVCQSEEYSFCNRITSHSADYIAVIEPHVVIHTGLTNSDGKPAPGYEERLKAMPKGIYYE